MKKFDTFDIDLRPALRRSAKRPAHFPCCYLFDAGSSETTNNTTVNNDQATISGGSNSINLAATRGGVVNYSADASVLANAEQLAESSVTSAFQFGAEAETINSQEIGSDDATINALAGQITGNASTVDPTTGLPQTNAPAMGIDWGKLVNIALILGTAVSVLAFIDTKGKSS